MGGLSRLNCLRHSKTARMSRPARARKPLEDAAIHLFVHKGYHAASIRDIAQQAGCSEAALYRHWTNKEDLVRHLFLEHLGTVNALLEASLLAEGSLAERILSATSAIYELYDQTPEVFRFVLLVQHEIAPFIPPGTKMPQDVLIDWIGCEKVAGRVKGDPVELSAALIGVFVWTAQYVLYQRLPGPLIRYRQAVAERALAVLGAT